MSRSDLPGTPPPPGSCTRESPCPPVLGVGERREYDKHTVTVSTAWTW